MPPYHDDDLPPDDSSAAGAAPDAGRADLDGRSIPVWDNLPWGEWLYCQSCGENHLHIVGRTISDELRFVCVACGLSRYGAER